MVKFAPGDEPSTQGFQRPVEGVPFHNSRICPTVRVKGMSRQSSNLEKKILSSGESEGTVGRGMSRQPSNLENLLDCGAEASRYCGERVPGLHLIGAADSHGQEVAKDEIWVLDSRIVVPQP